MSKTLVRMAAGFALMLVLQMSVWGAVDLSVSPSMVGNSYTGLLTFTISGLTNGILDRYLGLNSNRVINVTEPLTARYALTDSVVSAVGGVLNTAVPFDQDHASNQQIVVRLPFQTLDPAGRIAGAHHFRLTIPKSSFVSVTTSLLVTQTASRLVVTGTVFTVNRPESNAVVTLFDLGNEFVSGTVADLKGNYSLSVAPGEYRLVACVPGRSSIGKTTRLSVFNVTAIQKLHLTNSLGTRRISGVVRQQGSGTGLPGLQLFLFSTNAEATFTFTDATGAFSAPVTPGQWTLVPSEVRLGQLGCNAGCVPIVCDTSGGDVTNNIDLATAPSLVYGSVVGTNHTAIAGISVRGKSSLTAAAVITDTNGEFATGVAPGSDWYWEPDPVALGRIGYLSPRSLVSIPSDDKQEIRIQAPLSASRIQGRVQLDDGTPLADSLVVASSDDATPVDLSQFEQLTSAAYTRSDGTFDIGACAGSWFLNGDPTELAARSLLQPYTVQYSLTNGGNTNINLVFRRITSTITVAVRDKNGYGVVSAQIDCEAMINGILYDVGGSTDESGRCVLGLCDGTWLVTVGGVENYGLVSPAPKEITVSNLTTNIEFTVEPPSPLVITTQTLPVAYVGCPYDYQMQANGGSGAYIWEIAGGGLPDGLEWDSSGMISGVTTGSASAGFTVAVQDGFQIRMKDFSLISAYPAVLQAVVSPVNHKLTLKLAGELNRPYVLEAASQISGPWLPVLTNRITAPESIFYVVPATNSATFYRVLTTF